MRDCPNRNPETNKYPDEREIAIHKPGQPVIILGIEDTLTLESVLPNFKVAVKDIFPAQDDN